MTDRERINYLAGRALRLKARIEEDTEEYNQVLKEYDELKVKLNLPLKESKQEAP